MTHFKGGEEKQEAEHGGTGRDKNCQEKGGGERRADERETKVDSGNGYMQHV